MQYRQLGKSGVRVSVIGLGGNRLGLENKVPQQEVNCIIDACQEAGINFIDSANVYTKGRSEETLGVALKGRWDRFVVATKYGNPVGTGPNDSGGSRYHLANALEASLRRLQSDHIDLYYMHNWDEFTPIEESLRTLGDAVQAGKVRYLGASNFAAWQLASANLLAEIRGWESFVCEQAQYNMLEREPESEILPYCRAKGVGFIPYFPLAGGFLTGKYQRNQPAPPGSRGENSAYVQKFMTAGNFDRLEKMTAWAQARSHSMYELAEAWLLAQPAVCSVITGATKAEQVSQNAQAGDWILSADEVKEVTRILDSQDQEA